MEITIATRFDTQEQKEVVTSFYVSPALVKETLLSLLNKMNYEQRQAWIAKNEEAVKLTSVKEL